MPSWWSLYKNPKITGFGELPVWWTHLTYQAGDAPHIHGNRNSYTQYRSSQTSPYVPLHLTVHLYLLSYHLLHNKLVNISLSLNSVSCSSKWSNSRGRKSWELQVYSPTGQKLWVIWGPTTCGWHLKWGGQWSLRTKPLTCGIWCYLQLDSVRIYLNCTTPSWCHK